MGLSCCHYIWLSGSFSYLTEVLKKCGEIFTAYVCAGLCQLMIKSYRKQKRIESNTCILYILHHVYERISFICGLIIASTIESYICICLPGELMSKWSGLASLSKLSNNLFCLCNGSSFYKNKLPMKNIQIWKGNDSQNMSRKIQVLLIIEA